MAYPYLPVNPCCTDVVLNTPCGCSSTVTNSGCNDNPCSTHLTASSTIVYDGPALTCTTAEPCDTLNVILQKIDEIICNLLGQINTLTIQVDNITTQVITINNDIININNQLDVCCNVTTTTTSTTAHPCESFSLNNIGEDPVAIIITDCITGEQEAIVLLPGDTNICVETDSPLTVPGTVIVTPNGPCGPTTTTTTTIEPTTTTTTTAYACECITIYNGDSSSHVVTYTDCNGVVDEGFVINPLTTVQVCGCCALATSEFVTFSIGANCVDGACPTEPTTTTTTITPPPPTTTTTTTLSSCNCVDIIISQDDIDDATGNAFLNGNVSIEGYIKDTTCDNQDIPVHYDTAGTYRYCLKTPNIPYFSLFYLKDNEIVTDIQSEIVNLGTECSVAGPCAPITTTTSSSSTTTTTSSTSSSTTTSTTTLEPTTTTTSTSSSTTTTTTTVEPTTTTTSSSSTTTTTTTVEPTTTTTTTIAPTTTTTTSGVTLTFATISSTSAVTNACGLALNTFCWVSNVAGPSGSESVSATSVVYTDAGGTTEFPGNGQFYHVAIDSSSVSTSSQINGTGNVIGSISLC